MLEKYLEQYVEELYNRQNIGACLEQQGLFTKSDYYKLLKPVIELVKTHKDYTIEEMRQYLYEQSRIEEKVKDIIYNREMVPGVVFSYGTKNYKETIVIGNRQEVSLDQNGKLVSDIKKMEEDTIFDLASVTKLFTSLSLLKLVEVGLIKLDDQVIKYAPEFKNLKEVTVLDLMSFNVPLKTNRRVDRANSKEEAEQILFNIKINKEDDNLSPYTDMGAMILKYVVECASGMNFYDFVDANILSKVKMNDTYIKIPNLELDRVASTNYDGKYYKDGNFSITMNQANGIAYDQKAQIMGQSDGILSGHAGLFSTVNDMTKLAQGLIDEKIVNSKYIAMMAKNRTGKKYIVNNKEKYIQYLGLLCYSKNPILSNSELYHAMSGRAFASAGWTGTQLTVDPVNELYFFMASNRSHNRMTFIDPAQKEKIITDKKGKKTIMLPDGSIKIDATRFAWDRDEFIVHPALRLAIQYKMLEDIYSSFKENKKEMQKLKKIGK